MDWNDVTYPKVLLGVQSEDRRPVRTEESWSLRSFWRPLLLNSCHLDMFTSLDHEFKYKTKLVLLNSKTLIHCGCQSILIIWYDISEIISISIGNLQLISRSPFDSKLKMKYVKANPKLSWFRRLHAWNLKYVQWNKEQSSRETRSSANR
jgi:hypothetical protein